MSTQTNFLDLNSQKNFRRNYDFNKNSVPFKASCQQLPTLNAVSHSLVPITTLDWEYSNSAQQSIQNLYTHSEPYLIEFPMQPYYACQELEEIATPGEKQSTPRSHGSTVILPLPEHTNLREKRSFRAPVPADISTWSKDLAIPEARSNNTRDISKALNYMSPKQMKASNKSSSKKSSCSRSFCLCDMTRSQASLAKKVVTPNNMRFFKELSHYYYKIKQEISPSSGNPFPKYVCKHKGSCNKEFERTWNLLDHCRTHFGVKPYSCDVCGRKFTQKGNRNKHMLKHNNCS
ncbi:unnamed protein product [Moneuplotes crassus]|uniref:C2H2-type domain-containing protein n=1 Tax=Euplotes crassus TaxID=5936 RepID=A0AAD1XCH9_EUPCR|nr:unnamed protein product [Moneuplotes crassus]